MTSKKLMEQFKKIARGRRHYLNALYYQTAEHRPDNELLRQMVYSAERSMNENNNPIKKEFGRMIGDAITTEIEVEVQ